MQAQQANAPVEVLNERGAILDPVSAVEVQVTTDNSRLRTMDMPANDSVHARPPSHFHHRRFVVCDELHRGLRLVLEVRGEGPITEAEPSAHAIDVQIQVQNQAVELWPPDVPGGDCSEPARRIDGRG